MSGGEIANVVWKAVRALGVWGVVCVSAVVAITVITMTYQITRTGYAFRLRTATAQLDVQPPAIPLSTGVLDAGVENLTDLR